MTEETARNGKPRRAQWAASASRRSASCRASSLVPATMHGFFTKAGEKLASSPVMVSKSLTGSGPPR